MKVLRGVGVLALTLVGILIAVFLVLVNFSETKSVFRCEGKIGEQEEVRSATIFMTLSEYRWWVALWSKSQGMVLIEAPKELLPYEPFLGLDRVGDSARHIYKNSTGLRGAFYKVSRYLMLDTPSGHFEGNCTPS